MKRGLNSTYWRLDGGGGLRDGTLNMSHEQGSAISVLYDERDSHTHARARASSHNMKPINLCHGKEEKMERKSQICPKQCVRIKSQRHGAHDCHCEANEE